MAYNDKEKSTHGGKPRELYRFEGTFQNYYYTSSDRFVDWQAPDETEVHRYLPITLQRSEVTAGTPDDDNLDLSIEMPIGIAVVTAYAFNNSPPDLSITIWRFHELDSVIPYWKGRITNVSIQDSIATFTSPSELGSAMTQEFPNVYYQTPCNHTLYDGRCKVPEAGWTVATTVTAIAGKLLTLATIDNDTRSLNGMLIGGEARLPSGERRMVVTQYVTTPVPPATVGKPQVQVNFEFASIKVGDTVILTAGCIYAWAGDCAVKFANQLNFGGFPFVGDNVFQDGVQDGSTLPDNTCTEPGFNGTYMGVRLRGGQIYYCNPNWDGVRNFILPNQRPNGPNGKLVTSFSLGSNGNPRDETYYEVDNPALDRRLRGQALYRFVVTDFNTVDIEFFFPVQGPFKLHLFPSARYCGSANTPKDPDGYGRFEVFLKRECSDYESIGEQYGGGNTNADWDWE